jgi:two-component system sensor histidine kinase YesM
VIVPIIVFSWAFYNSVTKSAEKEKLILFNQAVDRIGNEIESNAVSAIVTSNIIYADLDMYKLLNRAYQDTQEYLDIYYTKMKDMWSKILPYNTNITILSLYTNNETVLRSNYIYKLEEKASGNNWYDEFNKRNVDAAFINHIDEVSVGYVGSKLVSYVRRLDNVKSRDYTHILRITFREDAFEKALRSESLPGHLYLVDKNNLIIARSDRRDTYSRYVPFDQSLVDSDQEVIRKNLPMMDNWQVICILDKDFMKADFVSTKNQIVLLMLFVTIFASVIIWSISASFYKRINILVKHMEKVEKEEYEPIPERKKGNDEIGQLFLSLNKMIAKIKILIENVYKAKIRETQLELMKKQSELNALQVQVNPHFMFNVLETIRVKSYMKNEFETARIIKYMSKIFRKLLQWDEDMIALREELKFIQEYLEIQQYRYEEELEFEILADDSLLDLKIPKMTLQTLVDNACEHGFSGSKGMKVVKVTASVKDHQVVMTVFDNGIGMDQGMVNNIEEFNSRGIGIKNVIGRLNLYFDGNYSFKVNSKPGEFTEIVLTLEMQELKERSNV